MKKQSSRTVIAATSSLVAVAASSAWSAPTNWYVTNSGADSPVCGTARDRACRSISQAIENASDGDVIWVGAGRYGDVSGRGDFTSPGDEHARDTGRGPDEGVSCVLCITKAVAIYSYNGTAATTISGNSAYGSVVQVLSDKVVFGSKDHGFTLTGGPIGVALSYDAFGSGLPQVSITVAGNVTVNAATAGYAFFGFDVPPHAVSDCPVEICFPHARVLFAQNTAVGGGAGFFARAGRWSSAATIRDNLAFGAGTGFMVDPGGVAIADDPINATAIGIRLVHNVATNNQIGFNTVAAGDLNNNLAAANAIAGFLMVPGGAAFQGNAATGNGGPGAIVSFFYASFGEPRAISAFSRFTQNDFYGNDRNRPQQTLPLPGRGAPGYDPGPAAHCGVLNVGVVAQYPPVEPPLPRAALSAPNNFWGAATGPAQNGSADAVGGPCDQSGGVTSFQPFSPIWFPIVPLPQ
jgi:hypothetical protein